MSLMSKLTAAYIAGFVDGEGYIGIVKDSGRNHFRRTDSYGAVIKIANTNEDIIKWFHDSYGGCLHKRKMLENQKDAYCWTLEGEKLVPFLDKIKPYLRMKKEQAEIIKELRKTFSPRSYTYIERVAKNGGRFVSKTTNPEVIEIREKLYQRIRELNHRGKTLHAERLIETTPQGDVLVRTYENKES